MIPRVPPGSTPSYLRPTAASIAHAITPARQQLQARREARHERDNALALRAWKESRQSPRLMRATQPTPGPTPGPSGALLGQPHSPTETQCLPLQGASSIHDAAVGQSPADSDVTGESKRQPRSPIPVSGHVGLADCAFGATESSSSQRARGRVERSSEGRLINGVGAGHHHATTVVSPPPCSPPSPCPPQPSRPSAVESCAVQAPSPMRQRATSSAPSLPSSLAVEQRTPMMTERAGGVHASSPNTLSRAGPPEYTPATRVIADRIRALEGALARQVAVAMGRVQQPQQRQHPQQRPQQHRHLDQSQQEGAAAPEARRRSPQSALPITAHATTIRVARPARAAHGASALRQLRIDRAQAVAPSDQQRTSTARAPPRQRRQQGGTPHPARTHGAAGTRPRGRGGHDNPAAVVGSKTPLVESPRPDAATALRAAHSHRGQQVRPSTPRVRHDHHRVGMRTPHITTRVSSVSTHSPPMNQPRGQENERRQPQASAHPVVQRLQFQDSCHGAGHNIPLAFCESPHCQGAEAGTQPLVSTSTVQPQRPWLCERLVARKDGGGVTDPPAALRVPSSTTSQRPTTAQPSSPTRTFVHTTATLLRVAGGRGIKEESTADATGDQVEPSHSASRSLVKRRVEGGNALGAWNAAPPSPSPQARASRRALQWAAETRQAIMVGAPTTERVLRAAERGRQHAAAFSAHHAHHRTVAPPAGARSSNACVTQRNHGPRCDLRTSNIGAHPARTTTPSASFCNVGPAVAELERALRAELEPRSVLEPLTWTHDGRGRASSVQMPVSETVSPQQVPSPPASSIAPRLGVDVLERRCGKAIVRWIHKQHPDYSVQARIVAVCAVEKVAFQIEVRVLTGPRLPSCILCNP